MLCSDNCDSTKLTNGRMSAPVNFNTASIDELKTVLSKTKSHAVIEARRKAGGHLTIKAFCTAAKLTATNVQKMISEGVIIYQVDTSSPAPTQDTPPTSEDPSPIQAEDEVSVPGATAIVRQPGFQLTPAKLTFTPSGLPYTNTQGGGSIPSNRAAGDPSPRPSPKRTTTQGDGNPAPQLDRNPSITEQKQPVKNKLVTQVGGNLVPTSPKLDNQLKALQEELARMREELEAKKSKNLTFRERLSTTEHQLASSQGAALRFQQQLGEAQQTAAESAQKAEEYQRALQDAKDQSQQELEWVQREVERYKGEAKELEEVADSIGKKNKKLDLKVLQAKNEAKRLTEESNRQAARVRELGGHLQGQATRHSTLLKEEADKVRETEAKWREEVAQWQALQKSVKEREEQLAKARLEYEDKVCKEEARRVALEDQLRTIPPAPQNVNPPAHSKG